MKRTLIGTALVAAALAMVPSICAAKPGSNNSPTHQPAPKPGMNPVGAANHDKPLPPPAKGNSGHDKQLPPPAKEKTGTRPSHHMSEAEKEQIYRRHFVDVCNEKAESNRKFERGKCELRGWNLVVTMTPGKAHEKMYRDMRNKPMRNEQVRTMCRAFDNSPKIESVKVQFVDKHGRLLSDNFIRREDCKKR